MQQCNWYMMLEISGDEEKDRTENWEPMKEEGELRRVKIKSREQNKREMVDVKGGMVVVGVPTTSRFIVTNFATILL